MNECKGKMQKKVEKDQNRLLFYDIEVFRYDSLMVLKDTDGHTVAHFWSALPGEFPEDSPNGFEGVMDVIRDSVLVGYNNHHYDDLILYKMLTGRPQTEIKALNDRIIGKEDTTHESWCVKEFLRKNHLVTLDCIQQIGGSHPSLKKIEGNLGRSIIESDVPFDIDRPLTATEKESVLKYCEYDVESTIAVYRLREETYFEPKKKLVEMCGIGGCYRWNTTSISSAILRPTHYEKWEKNRVPKQFWRKNKQIPESVWAFWEREGDLSTAKPGGSRETISVKAFGCKFGFGVGGIHGVAEYGKDFRNVIDLDVASMYPSIIVNQRILGEGTENYRELRDERVRIKKTDPVRSSALKLMLNSVYGSLKDEHSNLYNPMASVTVCVFGQIAAFDLSGRLYDAGYTLVNVNTDGVCFTDRTGAGDRYLGIKKEWEKEYGLTLEEERFDRLIQKDVNNYIAVIGKKVKFKGGDCNHYNEEDPFGNNDARIVQKAFVDKILHGKDPLETILENLDRPEMFQYVLAAGGTYLGTSDPEGNLLKNKTNRVFAAREGCPEATKLFKLRKDGGKVNYAKMPDRMFIYNGDLRDFRSFREIVDISHYYKMAAQTLERWRC